MSYSVDLIYSKNQDLSNPSTETESGQPSEMELTNLDSNQRYYTKAVLKNDGVTEDESDIETFQTIPAGVITLEHISTVRSGYGYDVTYRYTSTYAPSSAILSTNSTNFQGVVDSAQHTVSFWVTGLTPGTAYLTQVTMTDIYTESVSVQGSIVATVVNEIRITDTESTEDTIECFLDYILDDGFQQGYVEYWEAYDDPSTDQPQGHFYFSNGDTSVICDNLSSSTEYQFRATVLQPNSNSVVSTVVRASTESGIEGQCLTITNVSQSNNTIQIDSRLTSTKKVSVSLDEGSTWTEKSITANSQTSLGTISPSGSMMIRHVTGAKSNSSARYIKILATAAFDVSGNLASLNNTNFTGTLTMGDYEYFRLFQGNTYLNSAENLYIGYTSVPTYGFREMFKDCSNLTTSPGLSAITTVGSNGMYAMFQNCTSLSSISDMTGLTSVYDYGLYSMFQDCTGISAPPFMSGITSVNAYGLRQMFQGCTSLEYCPNFGNLASVGNYGMNSMFKGCTSITESPDLSAITSVGTYSMNYMFEGCTNLEVVYAPTLSWDTSNFNSWLNNVAPYGEFYVKSEYASTIPINSASGCPTGWTKVVGDTKILTSPTINVNRNTGTITVTGIIPPSSGATLQYKEQGAAYRTYTEPLLMNNYTPPLTVYARKYTQTAGWQSSAETSETISKYTLAAPEISRDSTTKSVTISYDYDTFANASVHYTTDGTTPTSSSTLYTGSFVPSVGATVKAIAIAGNSNWYSNSSVAELPSDITLLDYVHNSVMECNGTPVPIDTGIQMTSNTSFRIKGMYKNLGTGNYTVGTDTTEFNEMRLFLHVRGGCEGSCSVIYDLYRSRITNDVKYYYDGDIFDLTCGNYYVYNNISESYMYNSGALVYDPIGTIKINVGQIWVNSIEILQNNVTVFNGVAAYDRNLDAYGLYDTISQTLFTNSNANIVGEDISE